MQVTYFTFFEPCFVKNLCNKNQQNAHFITLSSTSFHPLDSLNIYIYIYSTPTLWCCGPTQAMASSFLRFLDHTQRRITFDRTPLDEWSARRRDLYLTTLNTDVHVPGGIRAHNPSKREAVDARLRSRSHWDRRTDYMDAWKKYHKTACTNLPEDEHLDIRNMSKTL